MKKRVLILYEKTGMGHLRMTRILEEILREQSDVEVVCCAGSDLLHSTSVETLVELWNTLIRKNRIRTVDALLNYFVRLAVFPWLEISDTAKLFQALDELHPDCVISTADGFNKALGAYTVEKNIPFFILITDIAVFADLVHPAATHICYFDETVKAIQDYDLTLTYFSHTLNASTRWPEKLRYVAKYYWDFLACAYRNRIYRSTTTKPVRNNGVSCLTIGPLAESKHFRKKEHEALRTRLNLRPEADAVLIASGSIGGQYLFETVEILEREYTRPADLLVMCGNDDVIFESLQKRAMGDKIRMYPFQFVDNFDEFLAAADCVVMRPSAGIFIETLLDRTPVVAFGRTPSNDYGSIAMIEKYGLGEVCNSPESLPGVLHKVAVNRPKYVEHINQLLEGYPGVFEEKGALLVEAVRARLFPEKAGH